MKKQRPPHPLEELISDSMGGMPPLYIVLAIVVMAVLIGLVVNGF